MLLRRKDREAYAGVMAALRRSDQREEDFRVFARDLITRMDKRLAELDREFARRQAETNARIAQINARTAQIQAEGETGRAALWAILDKLGNGPATA